MTEEDRTHSPEFHLVILGGDIGVYALARSAFEAYGERSTVISGAALGPIARSSIIDVVALGMGASVKDIAEKALEIAPNLQARYKGKELILLTNSDSQVRAVIEMSDKLKEYYHLPMVDLKLLDMVQDKLSFAKLCEKYEVKTPKTVGVDLSSYNTDAWVKPKLPDEFPLVAKPANSAHYERLRFEGMKKVYFISNQEELDHLWKTLYEGGVRSHFVLQQLIPGDDQCMQSLTAYVDSNHKVTMFGSAQVLLEEHVPTALGNPAAMITRPFEDLYGQAQALLEGINYTGFANFDVKKDPRDNTQYFLEVNPRIGRNNYYNTAAGLNPVEFLVRDIICHEELDLQLISQEVLYTVLTTQLLKRYISKENKNAVSELVRAGRVVNPLWADYDKGLGIDTLKRRTWIVLHTLNHYKKFRRHYPKKTDSGF